jgi:type I restriction enzyme, S subunit
MCFIALWHPLDKNASGFRQLQTQPNVNAEAIKRIEVQLPSIDEQREIVRRVEALFAYADRLEARYTAACAQVERLTPALLAKAFRGELVSQDPNDESASALLERIRAARAASEGATRPRPAQRRQPLQEIAEIRGSHAHAQRHPRYASD